MFAIQIKAIHLLYQTITKKEKNMTTKFHKVFGQVTIVSQDDTFTIVLTASGEEKTLMTQFTKLSDTPVEPLVLDVIKPKKTKKYTSYQGKKTFENADGTTNHDAEYAFQLRMDAKKYNLDTININL